MMSGFPQSNTERFNITVIALWLGHEQTATTDIYLHADMTTKQDALDRTRPPGTQPGTYTPTPDIIAWLNSLGNMPTRPPSNRP